MAMATTVGASYLHSYGDGFGIVKPSAVKAFDYSGEQNSDSKGRIQICSKRELERTRAVTVIERWWGVVKDKRVFHMLKQAICASEYSLTREIIRKVSPIEAELLSDPAIQAKIKFRFGGEKFPPIILFKIFTSMCTSEQVQGKVQYISGRRMIRPSSEAAVDAKRQMGGRRFHQQVLHDMNEHEHFGATDEVDITTTKDYMQYMANIDESPAYQGGKDNAWRRLDLTSLPRHIPLHNLVDLLDNRSHSVPLQQLETSLQTRANSTLSDYQPSSSRRSRVQREAEESRGSDGGQRRSRQARKRMEQMKKAYREGRETAESQDSEKDEEPWEGEIEDLYQWTQKLSFDDIR